MEISFRRRWKEELVCTSSEGQFGLEITMGIAPRAYFPTEAKWKKRAPSWAIDHWESIYSQLKAWCEQNHAELCLDETAFVFPVD